MPFMLRTCAHDGVSHNGFVWPESGYVECPDWDPNPDRDFGGGLHGLPNGDGDWALLTHPKGRWMIVRYDVIDEVRSRSKTRIRRGLCETIAFGDLWGRLLELRGNLDFQGSLDLRNTQITSLPEGLKVGGGLDLYGTEIEGKYKIVNGKVAAIK
jgi:hypothetical protein